ncbi:ABC transporter permease subunit [Roseivirga sp.]|uniref:ABC transporter permease subunit n=1 Tax=Roseivirga sp. TaxID=1964215 RepID=UPI003B8E7810
MLGQNIRHEIKLLSRNYWFLSLTLIIAGLSIYAGSNGLKQFEKRQANLQEAIQNQAKKVSRVSKIAIALGNGEEHPDAFRLSPMNYGIATGSLAIMPAGSLSKLAVGQSDLYTHQVNISSREDLATMSFNELNNPVQLLFGNFDLSFVLTYLIPLLIIAFTYNLKSQELETGRFRLLASNPINIKLWLLQRFVVRFFTLVVVITVVLIATMLSIGVKPDLNLFQFFGLTYAYMAFWFALTFLVNVFGFSSARNAVSLLSLWILLVLIVPTVVNQMANTIYPIPSRVALLNEI